MSRASIRLRLALWCAGLVTVSGAIVVLAVLALSGQLLHDRARPLRPPPARAAVRPLQQRGRVVQSTLAEARVIGLAAIGVLALCSVGIGWVVAGRMVRPVHVLAETAHAITATSLDRRIALTGPEDELKELADAFDGMLDRLDAAFASQRRFVADASHELRTPLAAIRAELDAVLDDPDASPAELRAAGARVGAVLDRAEALVEALLTLSRSDAVRARGTTDLAQVARDVVTATPAASALRLELDLDEARVPGDPALLERLVGNLVENACRYNVRGGLLAISTGSGGGAGRLTVANDGAPIPPDEVASLTERFHRRERTADGGFGLGLAIAHAIARGHGGTLTLAARPGGGLEARAVLPGAAPAKGPPGFEPGTNGL